MGFGCGQNNKQKTVIEREVKNKTRQLSDEKQHI
jgi:hypothetical protein